MDYEVTDVPEQTYAVIKRTVRFEELPQVMPQLIGQVHDWAHGRPGSGKTVTISSLAGDGALNIAPGVEIDASETPPAPIELVTRPAGTAAVYVHVGPYEELADVYRRFWDALQADGRKATGDPVEIYESGPHEPRPTTRIVWPIEA